MFFGVSCFCSENIYLSSPHSKNINHLSLIIMQSVTHAYVCQNNLTSIASVSHKAGLQTKEIIPMTKNGKNFVVDAFSPKKAMESDAIAIWRVLEQDLKCICRDEEGPMGKINK